MELNSIILHNLKTNKQTIMFIKSLLIATIATVAVAFGPASLARPTVSRLSMNAEGLAGETGPLGYFDPLGKICIYLKDM
jgi:hypothetical protein